MRKLYVCVFLAALVLVINEVTAQQQQCGGTLYDPFFDICCNGVVNPRFAGSSTACCGTQAYDTRFDICCSGTINPRFAGSSTACCGTQAYDTRFNRCCSGSIC